MLSTAKKIIHELRDDLVYKHKHSIARYFARINIL